MAMPKTLRDRLSVLRQTGGVFTGVPSYFRASCYEVASRRLNVGYEYAGQQLARHLERLAPYDLDEDDWLGRLESLDEAIDGGDREGVMAFLLHHFPRCMALVPARRRDRVVAGVFEYAEENQGILG